MPPRREKDSEKRTQETGLRGERLQDKRTREKTAKTNGKRKRVKKAQKEKKTEIGDEQNQPRQDNTWRDV